MTSTGEPPPLIAGELRNRSGLTIGLLANGSIFAIRHGDVLVNQVLGSPVEGGIGNLWLRRRTREGIAAVPLIGPASTSGFRWSGREASWDGSDHGLRYTCTLRLAAARSTWFWMVRLVNETSGSLSVDAMLSQDLGIAQEAAVRTNELYTSQYIDHTILQDEALGFLVCSRQNLPQGGGAFPWIVHGCLDGAVGYLTDGFQFYGLGYRATDVPAALARPRLPNRNYQYEFALPTVQSRRLVLRPGGSGEITFFAAFEPDHPAATSSADLRRARAAVSAFAKLRPASGDAPFRDDPPAVTRAPAATIAPGEAVAGAAGDRPPELGPASARRTTGDDAGSARPPAGWFASPILFPSQDLDARDLERHFGGGAGWRHLERDPDGTLLSFFHGRYAHVVLRAKELVQERPTGHILRSGRDLLPTEETLSVTAWMTGVFASQLTIGNTSFNKLLSVARNPLNVLKAGGQRIFVRTDRGYELLGLPSAFEMGPNHARWIYRDDRLTISVGTATSLEAPACRLTVAVEGGGPAELLISHEIVLGTNEYDAPGCATIDEARGRVELRPSPRSMVGERYPETTFHLVAPDPAGIGAIGRDGLLYEDGIERGGSHLVVRTKPVTRFSLVLTGSVLDAARAEELATAFANGRTDAPTAAPPARPEAADLDRDADPAAVEPSVDAFWTGLRHGAALGGAAGRTAEDLLRLDDLLRWYPVDAMVHLTSPHGLEQYSGAAWAVRDVSQGPVEFLVASGNPAPVRDIVRVVYEHQDRRTGDWPQWFMFDRYREIRASDSHADIIHWPIKVLCDYAETTGDLSVLDEEVAYTDPTTKAPTADTETIFAHTERQIDAIERGCIPGTALVVFAGGDWEDTLQPAHPAMAQRLVSGWTVELAYQTLNRYRVVCERAGRGAMAERLADLVGRMRTDFNRFLMPDGIAAGLAHFRPDGVDYFLHPRDRTTGVSYRLLPMTRGMISGMFTPDQATRHAALIERYLSFPDGVRLMDRPMAYTGGTSRIFRRAESAANFGREVGLQYVHAHIRYIEAMARIGRPDEAFRALMAVCPIRLELDVPSALPRQSNAYFSSSDADFADRRQASRRFGRLRTGRVGVKGGWRVYSSGPGIYLNQLVSNVLGLRGYFDDLVVDPVLPRHADGLIFDFEFEGRRVRYRYHVTRDGFGPHEIRVNGVPIAGRPAGDNPYRTGGMLIPRRGFRDALDRDENLVEVHI